MTTKYATVTKVTIGKSILELGKIQKRGYCIMNYESKLCKLSDGENHKQRRLTIIDYENVLPLGRIIPYASGYFALTYVKAVPFKVTSDNVLPWSKNLDYYEDVSDYHGVFGFQYNDVFLSVVKRTYPDADTLYVHSFVEVFF